MTRDQGSAAAQVQQLLEQAKTVRPLSQTTRARVLRRAHSSAAVGGSVHLSNALSPRTGASAVTWLGGAVLAISVGVAGAALYLHESRLADIGRAMSAVAVPSKLEPAPSPSASLDAPESMAPAAATRETVPTSRPTPILESYAAELALLRRAHTAYGGHDYTAALRLLAEHGRRFPNGRLAEEREALRVRALSGSGLNAAARLAAHAFAARFPHSVLLARTIAGADAGE